MTNILAEEIENLQPSKTKMEKPSCRISENERSLNLKSQYLMPWQKEEAIMLASSVLNLSIPKKRPSPICFSMDNETMIW